MQALLLEHPAVVRSMGAGKVAVFADPDSGLDELAAVVGEVGGTLPGHERSW